VDIIKSQEKITIRINNSRDLDKISSMKLDLLLLQDQKKKNKQGLVYKTEPLLVYKLPVKVHRSIPIKKATAKVNLVTITIIEQK